MASSANEASWITLTLVGLEIVWDLKSLASSMAGDGGEAALLYLWDAVLNVESHLAG